MEDMEGQTCKSKFRSPWELDVPFSSFFFPGSWLARAHSFDFYSAALVLAFHERHALLPTQYHP